MLIRELLVQYRPLALAEHLALPDQLADSKSAAKLLQQIIGLEAVEVCGVICVSSRRMVVAYHELTRGTIDQTLVHPRDVLRTALLAHVPAVIIGHNHPSGDVMPSPDDVVVTQRLMSAATVMGIELLDHLIVSPEGRYFSFRDAGLLPL